MIIPAGSTDKSVALRIVDSADGTPEQAVTSATAGLALWYWREGAAALVALTESDLATLDAAHSDGGMLHVDDGYYRVDIPDAAFATGADFVLIGGAATGMVVIGLTCQIGAVPTVAQIADGVWDEVMAGHNVKNSAATFLKKGGGGTQVQLIAGSIVSATPTTATLDNEAVAQADIYVGNLLVITGGLGAGQTRRIVDYTAARVATVDRSWSTTPNNTSTYELVAAPTSYLSDEGTVVAADATTITFASTAPDGDDVLNNSLVSITGGTGDGQTRVITDYVGATRTATVAAWDTTPDTTSTYAVIPAAAQASDSGGGATAPTTAEIASAVKSELATELNRIDVDVSSRAVAGDAMTLADDAITAAKFDETTAFPLTAADTGATYIARTGADSDTLGTLSDQLDALPAAVAVNTFNDLTYDTDGVQIVAGDDPPTSGDPGDTLTIGTPMVVTSAGAGIDINFEFELGTARVSELVVAGYYTGAGGTATSKYASVYLWDYVAAAWTLITDGSNRIPHGTANVTRQYVIAPQYQDPTTGQVKVRYLSSRVTTGDTLVLDQHYIQGVNTGFTLDEIANAVASYRIPAEVAQDGTHSRLAWYLYRSVPTVFGIDSIAGNVLTLSGDRFNSSGNYVGHVMQLHLGGTNQYTFARIVAQSGADLTLDAVPAGVDDTWHGYILPEMGGLLTTELAERTLAAADYATAAALATVPTAEEIKAELNDISVAEVEAAVADSIEATVGHVDVVSWNGAPLPPISRIACWHKDS